MSRPSSSAWRIAGALGITPDPTDPSVQEVITQGIGYPLRPVSSVPPTSWPELPDGTIAEGYPLQYMPNGWEQGKWYPPGAMVSNGEWLMVSNTLTLENPYPAPDGNPTYGLPTNTFGDASQEAVVYSGNLYTFNQAGWVKNLRVWVTELTPDTNYRVVVVVSVPGKDPVTSVIEEPVLNLDTWTLVAFLNSLVVPGTTILVYLDALNSGSDQQVTGGWTYAGPSQGLPAARSWNHEQQQTLVRIDKFDLDGTDRSSELAGFIPDTTLQFADTNNPSANFIYRVNGPLVDQGTYYEYPVVLQSTGEVGPPLGTTTLTATIPIAQPTLYVEQVGVATPAWATVQGYLAYDGVEQPAGQANAYGVDIEFEGGTFPTEWDILSHTPLT